MALPPLTLTCFDRSAYLLTGRDWRDFAAQAAERPLDAAVVISQRAVSTVLHMPARHRSAAVCRQKPYTVGTRKATLGAVMTFVDLALDVGVRHGSTCEHTSVSSA